MCACHKSGSGFSNVICYGLFHVHWLEARGGWSFCWYWWNLLLTITVKTFFFKLYINQIIISPFVWLGVLIRNLKYHHFPFFLIECVNKKSKIQSNVIMLKSIGPFIYMKYPSNWFIRDKLSWKLSTKYLLQTTKGIAAEP